MSVLSIRVDPFAGADITAACHDAIELADQLKITVMFKFNGVDCMACPGDYPDELAKDWDREMRGTHSMKLARARSK